MTQQLFVTKKYGTYADTFLMLGLAQLVEYALKATNQKSAIQLLDQGTHYCLKLKQTVNLELVSKLNYTNPFPPVKGQKTDIGKIPQETECFDTVEKTERRKLYREYLFQQKGKPQFNEDAPKPPHPSTQNGVILTSMRHDRNHNDLWQSGWQIKDYYGALLVALFTAFSQQAEDVNKLVNELFTETTGQKLPETASAVKIYLPTSVQGVNRIKADGNKVDSQKADWLSLWLIAGGLFTFGIAERIKIAERVYDWRVVVLEPQDIQLSKYRQVLNKLRQLNPPSGGHGIARFDAELILRFCQELLNHHQVPANTEEDEFDEDIRLHLNFGHTFGHAIEATGNFSITHGVAVGVGMQFAIDIAVRLSISNQAASRIESLNIYLTSLLKNVPHLAEQLNAIDADQLFDKFESDKKHTDKYFIMILPGKDGFLSKESVNKDALFKSLFKESFKYIQECYEIQ
jgi:hypothetical protein